MKKIVVLLLVLSLVGCGKKTHLFKIDNKSDWDVVVALTDFKEVGRFQSKSDYIISKKTTAVFELYETGTCNLISVNGAKVVQHNDFMMILENCQPKILKVINTTGERLRIKNEPALPGGYLSYHYAAPQFYVPLFKPINIEETHSTEPTAKAINIYAWQIEKCKTDEDLNNLTIGIDISSNSEHIYSYRWQKKDSDIFLIVSKSTTPTQEASGY